MAEVDWDAIRWVVFDVDGTLYDQPCLRRRVLGELGREMLRRPRVAGVLRIIYRFRQCREELADAGTHGIGRLQYERAAARLGLPPERVEAVIREWMHRRPLVHLRACRFPGVDRFVDRLREGGKRVGVLSDYPAEEKLAALGLRADVVVSAEDPVVDHLKPDPAGLLVLLRRAGASPEACLLIGDRDDRDGECARRAGVRFLLKAKRAPAGAGAFVEYDDLRPVAQPDS